MNLIKVNLLPYREQREAQLKKQFNLILGIGAITGLVVAGLIYVTLSEAIENQESRNASLEAGKAELEAKLKTVDELKARKHNFLERKRKVEELDNKRFEGARIIDSLNTMVPDGAFLAGLTGQDGKKDSKGIERAGTEYELYGFATNDTKIAELMSALPRTGVFDVPALGKIEHLETEGLQEFELKTVLVQQIALPKPKPTAPAANASAPAANK